MNPPFFFKRTLAFASILFLASASANAAVSGSVTYWVTSAASSGPGSLNEAVFQANYHGGDVNFINFNIPSNGGVVEIVLSQPLYIARLMILDGTTQPGYQGAPLVRINGNGMTSGVVLVGNVAGVPPFSDGRTATSSGSTIQGFQIINYSANAITIFNESQGNYIQNNWLGFYETTPGSYVRNVTTHPGSRGIGVRSSFNHIRNNTISGVDNGITLGDDINNPTGTIYKTNSIRDNFIGTDPAGVVKIGNDSDGIFLGAGARQNFIGPGNVLSGMNSAGCELLHSTTIGNVIIGNIIGLNAAGDTAIGNARVGVIVANGAHFNDVGSSDSKNGNVISGNALGGVVIGQSGYLPVNDPSGTWVENNLIGTDKTGTRALGNQGTGVTLQEGAQHIVVRFNVLAGHTMHGAVVANSTNNGFFGNWIGQTQNGTQLANHGYGVWLLNASRNYIGIGMNAPKPPYFVANLFGSNQLGPVGTSGNCVGNVIDMP